MDNTIEIKVGLVLGTSYINKKIVVYKYKLLEDGYVLRWCDGTHLIDYCNKRYIYTEEDIDNCIKGMIKNGWIIIQ